MAANLTPQYLEAEARYRAAKTPEEQLAALEEMWRELPKHKSSEKIQAELKKKLSAARKAAQQPGRKGATHADPFSIPRCGAGQVALLGTPNVGKSSIVGGLTHAHVKIADYPFATSKGLRFRPTNARPSTSVARILRRTVRNGDVDADPLDAVPVLVDQFGVQLGADLLLRVGVPLRMVRGNVRDALLFAVTR